MHMMQRLLISHRKLLCFAPDLDQALVFGCWVTSSDVIDNRFVQLRQQKCKHIEQSPFSKCCDSFFFFFLF